jgi:hypothetical protein
VILDGTLAQIHVRDPARRAALRDSLQRAPHARTWLREDLPAAWGVKENARIGDIVVVADEGWLIGRTRARVSRNPATHGYAPVPSMHGIFLAAGPRIRGRTRVPAFEAIHVYPLLAEVLGLRPNQGIDGRLDVLAPILRSGETGNGRARQPDRRREIIPSVVQ